MFFDLGRAIRNTRYALQSAVLVYWSIRSPSFFNTLYPSENLTVLTSLTRCESVNTDQRNGSETKNPWSKKRGKSTRGDSVKDPITVDVAQDSGALDYWSLYHNLLTNFGSVAIMVCSQQAGQGTSERIHQVTKQVRTKTSNDQSGVVYEIKLGIFQARTTDVNAKKIIQRSDNRSGVQEDDSTCE